MQMHYIGRTRGRKPWVPTHLSKRASTPTSGIALPRLSMGLTVSDAVRILLTRTANEGALPLELVSTSEAHDAWFRAKVIEALEDPRPGIPDEEVAAHFAGLRESARGRSKTKP